MRTHDEQHTSLYRSILSVLDMALTFADFFASYAGNATLDVSRVSIIRNRRRTRTQHALMRNIVSLTLDSHSGSESEDEDEDLKEPQTSFSFADQTSVTEDDSDKLGKMSLELDVLVKYIRRGVESLAGRPDEDAHTFEVIAFTLEGWDA